MDTDRLAQTHRDKRNAHAQTKTTNKLRTQAKTNKDTERLRQIETDTERHTNTSNDTQNAQRRAGQPAPSGDVGLEYCMTHTSRQAPPCVSMPHHTTLKVLWRRGLRPTSLCKVSQVGDARICAKHCCDVFTCPRRIAGWANAFRPMKEVAHSQSLRSQTHRCDT